ncbi:MAG: adenylyl-sulfate kinase [Pseudomonadota bacterium]|nr:adenylyl-sulfate kinase [Pseudomonadota bacterium]
MVIWITGLSGAGKTTIAKALVGEMRNRNLTVVSVDGDLVREIVGDPQIKHDYQSRLTNAYRICRFAKALDAQNFWVVVSTMSLFSEIHEWNRKNFIGYTEVLIQVDKEVLKNRNARNLYSSFEKGTMKDVVGFDLAAEEPKNPDLIIQNNIDHTDFNSHVNAILAFLNLRK